MNDYLEQAYRIASLIKKRNNIVVLTGAGISTASGLPDFRSHNGLWDGQKPVEISHPKKIGTPLFKTFFRNRILDIQSHQPNTAHHILSKWEADGLLRGIVTQNIDSYHQKAGSKNVVEVHGHLSSLVCATCGHLYNTKEYTKHNNDQCMSFYGGDEAYPCEGFIRPNVTLFGEPLDALAWHRALTLIHSCDLLIVLGTSLSVAPVNTLVEEAYRSGAGASVVIINKSSTPFDYAANICVQEDITATLTTINDILEMREGEAQ